MHQRVKRMQKSTLGNLKLTLNPQSKLVDVGSVRMLTLAYLNAGSKSESEANLSRSWKNMTAKTKRNKMMKKGNKQAGWLAGSEAVFA